MLTPGLVFAADGRPFARAIEAAVPRDVEIVVTAESARRAGRRRCSPTLLAAQPTAAVDAAHAKVGPDTIAKFLFTSGSTSYPKGVINTQRMLCANQADDPPALAVPRRRAAGAGRLAAVEPHLRRQPQLRHGALQRRHALHRRGQADCPAPSARPCATCARSRRPSTSTCPRASRCCCRICASDAALRQNFFSRVKVLFYAGAGLAQHVWDELAARSPSPRAASASSCSSSLGTTETAPCGARPHLGIRASPATSACRRRGVELKLVPSGGKLEVRYRGPNITPGYWRRPELTADAFDDEGFYTDRRRAEVRWTRRSRQGPAVRRPHRRGLQARRPAPWSASAPLRAKIIDHCAPLVHDAVIAGIDRDDIGVLVFPDVDACRKLAGLAADAPPAAVLGRRASCATSSGSASTTLARQSTGSSTRICRAHADGRAAVARQRRGDRQGLDQPARRADPPRRAGGGALCRHAVRAA